MKLFSLSVSSTFRIAMTALIVGGLSTFPACKTAKKVEDGATVTDLSGNGANADANTLGDSDSGRAMGLQTVPFPYDSFTLSPSGKEILNANAKILKENTTLRVQIEGHCDQRGGIQYNIALGEKRANAAKKYLEDAGISGDRIATISYGKERPLDSAENEAAYSKNRRANFAITQK